MTRANDHNIPTDSAYIDIRPETWANCVARIWYLISLFNFSISCFFSFNILLRKEMFCRSEGVSNGRVSDNRTQHSYYHTSNQVQYSIFCTIQLRIVFRSRIIVCFSGSKREYWCASNLNICLTNDAVKFKNFYIIYESNSYKYCSKASLTEYLPHGRIIGEP
jgi:hypothetical protein